MNNNPLPVIDTLDDISEVAEKELTDGKGGED